MGGTCALCDTTGQLEQLRDGWRVCGRCGLAYRVDEQGVVIEWATTSKSHPRGVTAVKA
jgi:hypothetical protein